MEVLSLDKARTILTGLPDAPPGARLAPSPPGLPLLGHLGQMKRGSLRLLEESRERYGDVVRFRFGGLTMHLVSDPALIRAVLQERNRQYTKETRGVRALRLVLGRGLLTSRGDHWLRQRRIAQPAFHRKRIHSFGATMVRAGEEMVDGWRDGAPLDVHEEMMRVTLRIVAETMLSANVEAEARDVGPAVDVMNAYVNYVINLPFGFLRKLPTARNREFARQLARLDGLIRDIIRERRRSGPGDDLLSMLMEARDEETGEGMSDDQLRDEALTIFLAGHETTANALAWTFVLLGRHPEVRRRLEAEVDEVLGDRPATVDDLPALSFTQQVLKEAMRLYPPVWMTARAAAEDDDLGGYFIPHGSMIAVSPWVMHRHPDHWENPGGFDPDRWAPGRPAPDRFVYFPFGGGPRRCIGDGFAMVEATLLLATVARRARLPLVPGHPIDTQPLVTLRPRHGVRATVQLR